MKTKFFLFISLALMLSTSSCNVANKALGLINCTYELGSITNPAIAGISLANIASTSQFNAINMLKLTSAIAQGSLPLTATVNVNAKNTGSTLAEVERMEWAIDIENKQVLNGVSNHRVSIPANGEAVVIPFSINIDLLKMIANGSAKDLLTLALNILNAGEQSSKVAIRIKPTILVAGKSVSPGFITLHKTVN